MYLQMTIIVCSIWLLSATPNADILKWVNEDFNFKQVNDFLNKTSYEAVSIMVFFQVLAISFIVGKFSMLYLLMWISFAFLVYSFTGPYFFLKWLLVVSSIVWHMVLFLWTHPYLIACSVILYSLYCIHVFWSYSVPDYDENTLRLAAVLEKLEAIEKKTEVLQTDILGLSVSVESLRVQISEKKDTREEYVEDWMTDVPYPLDRRREASMSRKKMKSSPVHTRSMSKNRDISP